MSEGMIYPDLPSEVATCLVRGNLGAVELDSSDTGQTPELRLLSGLKVTLTPALSQTVLTETSGKKTILAMPPLSVSTNEQGEIYNPEHPGAVGVRVVASTNPALKPDGFTWTISISASEANIPSWTRTFVAPADGEVDVATLDDSTPPFPGTPSLSEWLQILADVEAARGVVVAAVPIVQGYKDSAEAAADSVLGQVDGANAAATTATTAATTATEKAVEAAASALAAAGSATTAQTLADTMNTAIEAAISGLRSELLGKTILRDTGWIDLRSQLVGWTAKRLRMRRIGPIVYLDWWYLKRTEGDSRELLTMPVGFRVGNNQSLGTLSIAYYGQSLGAPSGQSTVGDEWTVPAVSVYITSDTAWPSDYPSIT